MKFVGAVIGLLAVITVVWFGAYMFARGPVVEILPGQVGLVKTPSGFQENIQDPRVFRLPSNWFGMNPSKLVTVDVSDNVIDERIQKLFMPEDRLNLDFEVIGTFAVREDDESKRAIFDRLNPTASGRAKTDAITFDQVYETYGRQVVRTLSQEVVAEYSIQYVLENLEVVSSEIRKAVDTRLQNTPLRCEYVGLGAVQPPAIIVTAQENAKKRIIEQQTEQAENQVRLTRADAALQVSLVEQQIDLLEAETQVLSDLILSDAVSPAYIAQRSLRAWEQLAANPNATFVLTTGVFKDPKSLLGLTEQAAQQFEIDEETQERLDEILAQIEEVRAAELKKMEEERQKIEQGLNENPTGDSLPDAPLDGSK